MMPKRLSACFLLLFITFLSSTIWAQEPTNSSEADTALGNETIVSVAIDQTPDSTSETIDKSNLLDLNRSSGFKPMTILRGLLGMLSLILIAFIFSTNRKAVS